MSFSNQEAYTCTQTNFIPTKIYQKATETLLSRIGICDISNLLDVVKCVYLNKETNKSHEFGYETPSPYELKKGVKYNKLYFHKNGITADPCDAESYGAALSLTITNFRDEVINIDLSGSFADGIRYEQIHERYDIADVSGLKEIFNLSL